ncbi:MAG: carboxylating nicotinate-nucleotide diphosphorylase [Planctomycetota bacterium]
MVEYNPVLPDDAMEADVRALARLAIQEDLNGEVDWTSVSTIPSERRGKCEIMPRQSGTLAGLVCVPWVISESAAELECIAHAKDGDEMVPQQSVMRLEGRVRDMLTIERIVLNMVNRLCGVATLTAQFVREIGDAPARLYDTRKTTPGWRRIEKYAVRCGGGHNHRTGLFDGFLIKDNHLALGGEPGTPIAPSEAVRRARLFAQQTVTDEQDIETQGMQPPGIVEIEVDSLSQLENVLPLGPDIVLVDNFTTDMLRQAVKMRDDLAPAVELEASGGVGLKTVREIAETGVDRISSGSLTHQAVSLDLGLDWVRG